MFTNVNKSLKKITKVNKYYQMLTNVILLNVNKSKVNKCLQIFANVNTCQKLLTNCFA